MAGKALRQNVVNVRIGMEREDDGDILTAKNRQQRLDDVENAGSEILTAVKGHQDNAAIAVRSS